MTFWFETEVAEEAQRFGLDPVLVKAICMAESSGRADAFRHEPGFWTRYLAKNPRYAHRNPRRYSSSYGLMQVMYSTAVQHGFASEPEALFAPRTAIHYGCRHLRWILDRVAGHEDRALAIYNGGFTGNETAPFRNADYVKKVRGFYQQIKETRQ
jgi:soluble lytic murein transglycosylase-like protein